MQPLHDGPVKGLPGPELFVAPKKQQGKDSIVDAIRINFAHGHLKGCERSQQLIMKRGKTISPEALAKLGAKRLAELLVEACQDDKPLRRKIELLLASKQGSEVLDGAISKRLTALSRAHKFVDWDEVPTLAAELDALREGIVLQLSVVDPRAASELMWRFLTLARPTLERVDDYSGRIADVFYSASVDIGSLLAKVPDLSKARLAERLHEGLSEDDQGFFAQIITSASEALGLEGRTKLRELLTADIRQLPSRQEKEDWSTVGWPRGRASSHLAALADTEGNVDAYIEAIRLGSREHIDAANVAQRLIAADRPAEAMEWLDKDCRSPEPFDLTIADLRIAACEGLGWKTDAQALRWRMFEATLSGAHLREHLKRLPDFDDFTIEQKALKHAATFPSALTALIFFVEWPALEAADRLVRQRISELDGRNFEWLGAAAQRLSEKWPVSATLLYRALVLSVLERGYAKAYQYAARDLASASMLAGRLPSDSGIPTHAAFHAELKAKHGRKYGFWHIVEDCHRHGQLPLSGG